MNKTNTLFLLLSLVGANAWGSQAKQAAKEVVKGTFELERVLGKKLVDLQAYLDAQPKYKNAVMDASGNHLLSYAIIRGLSSNELREDIIAELLKRDVDIEAKSQAGITALMRLIKLPVGNTSYRYTDFSVKSNKNVLQALLAKGANVNARDKEGNTPLIFAIESNQPQLVETLLHAGATIDENTLSIAEKFATQKTEDKNSQARFEEIYSILLQFMTGEKKPGKNQDKKKDAEKQCDKEKEAEKKEKAEVADNKKLQADLLKAKEELKKAQAALEDARKEIARLKDENQALRVVAGIMEANPEEACK